MWTNDLDATLKMGTKRFIIIVLSFIRGFLWVWFVLFCLGSLCSFYMDDYSMLFARIKIFAILLGGIWITSMSLKKNRAQLEEMKIREKISAFNKERN